MGKFSKIEWCDHTFNPWIGCQKVSPGCDHCYAEAMMDHRYKKVQWGPHGERKRTSEQNWKKLRQFGAPVRIKQRAHISSKYRYNSLEKIALPDWISGKKS
jgi:protein gp37